MTMKKLIIWIMIMLLLTGCQPKPVEQEESKEKAIVYSFSGENDSIAVHNGVIVLEAEEQVLYGGKLMCDGVDASEITAYKVEYYVIDGDEKKILLVTEHHDKSGGNMEVSEQLPSAKGEVISTKEQEKLKDNFYFELNITAADEEEFTYQIKLDLENVMEMK